jgi:uncharacterized protein (DUF302 family)
MIRFFLVLLVISSSALGQDNIVKYTFTKSFDEVVEVAKLTMLQKRFKVYNVIDFSKNEEGTINLLRPTTAILFGEPSLEEKLIKCNQELAAFLPLRVLVWQDADKINWIGFSNHDGSTDAFDTNDCLREIDRIYKILNDICLKAAS